MKEIMIYKVSTTNQIYRVYKTRNLSMGILVPVGDTAWIKSGNSCVPPSVLTCPCRTLKIKKRKIVFSVDLTKKKLPIQSTFFGPYKQIKLMMISRKRNVGYTI